MEMSFPHDMANQASSAAVNLRRLDMDILRVLAATPVAVRGQRRPQASRPDALLALFAGSGRADQVACGSFNPHFALALDHSGAAERQSENGVYHSASVNRKAARLLRSHAPICTNQAF